MSMVVCHCCGERIESRSMESCQICNSKICPQCAYENNGYCAECQNLSLTD